jgi:hypothetical protein
VNSKEENSYDFCMEFVQEFGLCTGLSYDLFHLVLCGYLSLPVGIYSVDLHLVGGGGGEGGGKVTTPAPTCTY